MRAVGGEQHGSLRECGQFARIEPPEGVLGAGMTSAERDRLTLTLLRRYQATKEIETRNRVFWMHTPLARLTLKRIAHPAQESDDMFQHILLGLFAAIEGFDTEFGVRFSTYAISKMRGAALEYRRKETWGNRGMQDDTRRLEQRQAALEAGALPTLEETMEGGPQMPHFYQPPVSLDAVCMGTDGEQITGDLWIDNIASSINAEFEALERLMTEDLMQGVDKLPPRERLVLNEYYWEGKTFREIGIKLKVSESRVFQLHGQAMARLRTRFDRPEKEDGVTLGAIKTRRSRRAA